MNRRVVINGLLLSLLAVLTLGCASQLDATGLPSLLGFSPLAGPGWPIVTLGPVQPAQPQAVEPAGILYVLDRPAPRFAPQLVPPPDLSRFVAVPRQKQRPPDQPVSPIRLLPGQPAQVETAIASLGPLVSVEVRVNGQPLGSGPESFPAQLLTLQMCHPAWQRPAATGLVELCPPEQLSSAGSLDLSAAASRQARLVLILTGQTPGTYRLTLTAVDLDGRRSQTEYHITVADSSL